MSCLGLKQLRRARGRACSSGLRAQLPGPGQPAAAVGRAGGGGAAALAPVAAPLAAGPRGELAPARAAATGRCAAAAAACALSVGHSLQRAAL